MKSKRKFIALLLVLSMLASLLPLPAAAAAAGSPDASNAGKRTVISLDGAWSYTDPSGKTSAVTVPHSWKTDSSTDEAVCTYERQVDLSRVQGQKLFLYFEAVSKIASVYIDDTLVGTHDGGYSAFTIDITDACAGKDTVTLRVEDRNISDDSIPIRGDFTRIAGIYRDVSLIAFAGTLYLSNEDDGSSGVYLSADINLAQDSAVLSSSVVLGNSSEKLRTAEVVTTVTDAEGNPVASATDRVKVSAGQTAQTAALTPVAIENVHLWQGTEDPYLYTVTTEVYQDGLLMDSSETHYGFRTVSQSGGTFYLNGAPYVIRGVGMHQDYNAETYVTTEAQKEADIQLVLEMGANAIRTAHYPHDQYIYDLCDRYGILVWNEIPFYGTMLDTDTYKASAERALNEMIKQYYNHPSIIVWGISNELNYSGSYSHEASLEEYSSFLQELADQAKALDPGRLVGEAQISNTAYMQQTAGWAAPADSQIDTIGFNLYNGWYGNVNGATEARRVNLAKTIQNTLTRYSGYFEEVNADKLSYVMTEYGGGGNILQHSSLGADFNWLGSSSSKGDFHPEEYESYLHESYIMAIFGDETNQIEKSDLIWASFAWCMFDFACYRNEGGMTLTNTKGLVTADRQTKKDAFYLYKANWNDEDFFTHICSSRYTSRTDQTTDIRVYSNCDTVELTVNGVNLGEGTLAQDHVFVWKDVTLAGENEKNQVIAVGTKDGVQYTDECNSWVYVGSTSSEEEGTPSTTGGGTSQGSEFRFTDDGVSKLGTWKWASDYIYQSHDAGLFSGDEKGRFNPDSGLTRAEAVTVLLALMGEKIDVDTFESGFIDGDDNWYTPYLAKAREIGLAAGYEDGTFQPDATISRAEFVTMVLAAIKVEPTVRTGSYTDVSPYSWYAKYVYTASARGLVSGYEDNTFRGENPISRAEAAVIVTRLI